jgi:hypothetical protein
MFGRIFDELNTLVATEQIVNLEGYYDAFGKRMQESIPADRYVQWAPVWNRLASVSYRYGNVGSDVKAFNANLQSAAAVVSGRAMVYSEMTPSLPQLPVTPLSAPLPSTLLPSTPLPPPPTSGSWQYSPPPTQ